MAGWIHPAYVATLAICAGAAGALILWRLAQVARGPRPAAARALNEWVWTLIPLVALLFLVYRSCGVAK